MRAVDGIDLSIGEGEIVGYIGPNGAGKSTIIKMPAGILVPTSGGVQVAGYVPWEEREAYTREIGVIIGTGSIINPALGLLLALGQVPADIPEWKRTRKRTRAG